MKTHGDYPELKRIRTLVEKYVGTDVSTRSRKRYYVFPRWIYFKLCSEYTGHSLSEIAGYINFDHSTINYMHKRWPEDFPIFDEKLKDCYKYLSRYLKGVLKKKAQETLNNKHLEEKAKSNLKSCIAYYDGQMEELRVKHRHEIAALESKLDKYVSDDMIRSILNLNYRDYQDLKTRVEVFMKVLAVKNATMPSETKDD